MSNATQPTPGWRRSSITRKQTLVILLTSSVSLLLACGGFLTYEVVIFRQSLVENLSTLADIVANNSTVPITFNIPKNATDNLATLRSERSVEAAWILDRKGNVFA